MPTLLMRFQAPMQSWGVSSRFSVRDTGREPSKSGVIGLICAAMGRERSESVEDLSQLKMGVRVDREGKLMKDYHIAQNVFKASGGTPKASEPSVRYYLSDAVFLVGLEGDLKMLKKIMDAIHNPKWHLYFGRKAFTPAAPIVLPEGLRDDPLEKAIGSYPLLVKGHSNGKKLRMVIEAEEGSILRNDVPLNFSERRFLSRNLHISFIDHNGETLVEVQDENITTFPE